MRVIVIDAVFVVVVVVAYVYVYVHQPVFELKHDSPLDNCFLYMREKDRLILT